MQPQVSMLLAGAGDSHQLVANEIGWAFVLRLTETAMLAGPTLLTGLVVAGILHAMVTPDRLNRLIGDHAILAPLKLLGLALLLPVCALGALPIAAELRRAGVRVSNIVIFLVASPVLSVIWVAHGYEAMWPVPWSLALGLVVVIAIVVGHAAGWGSAAETTSKCPRLPSMGRRLKTTCLAAIAAVDRPVALAITVAVVAAGATGALIEIGGFEHRLSENESGNIVWLAAVMPLTYLTPEMSVISAREAFRIGLLPGAAIPLMVGGVCLCLGTFIWVGWRLGKAVLIRFVITAAAAILAGGFLLQAVAPVDPIGIPDSHAFDHLCHPYAHITSATSVIEALGRGFQNGASVFGPIAFGLVVLMGLIHAIFRARIAHQLEASDSATAGAEDTPQSRWSRPMSGRSIVVAVVIILFAAGVASMYVVHAPPEQAFEKLDQTFSLLFQAVMLDEREQALALADEAERLAGRLQLSVAIRPWRHCDGCENALEQFKSDLRELRTQIETGSKETVRQHAIACGSTLKSYQTATLAR
jgi:uncharacterized membrane protein YraQ (UPF0718 family)